MRTIQLYLSDLKELLQSREFVSVRTCLKAVSPVDLADGWDHFTPEERIAIFRLSTRERSVQLFEELEPAQQLELINSLQRHDAERLLQDLDPRTTGRLVRELAPPMVKRLETLMLKGSHESVQKVLRFPAQTVGALMRSRYLTLDPKWTCRQALERIQLSTRLRRIGETHLDTLMVTNAQGGLLGVVGLKFLVVAPRDMHVQELMERAPAVFKPQMDQEEAVRLFTKYKLKSAPVVDGRGTVVGVLVSRDIFEVASEEVEEDFAKMAGTQAGVLSQSVAAITRVRLPWLITTCLGYLVISKIVEHFDGTLARVISLANFMPMIAAMGGNVGAQTATVVVRGLATGEVAREGTKNVIAKEMSVGALLGLLYGVAMGLVAYALYGGKYGWEFSFVVGLGMFVSMTAAATMGSLEPFIFRRAGIDPATATGPLITCFTDMTSTIVYLSVATWMLAR